MKLILKDIPRLDSLYVGGEPDEMYDKRRMSIENDSYVIQGDEEDITSIENWQKYGPFICTDYLQYVSYVQSNCPIWSSLSNDEKDYLISAYIKAGDITKEEDTSNKIAYLTGDKGLSMTDAQGVLLDAWSDYHIKERASCKARSECKEVSYIIGKYLSISDASDFVKTIQNLIYLFSTQGIRGVNEGDTAEGIFDFIESTHGSVYDTAGLREMGYTMINGDPDMDNFIDELMDVLRNGNYEG